MEQSVLAVRPADSAVQAMVVPAVEAAGAVIKNK